MHKKGVAGTRGGGGMQNKHVFNQRQDETKWRSRESLVT